MVLRSHTYEEIIAAFDRGDMVWALDTGNDGEDDVLLGTLEEVELDLLHHFDLQEMPVHWTLEQLIKASLT